jgi:hypothetical protein
VVLTMKIKQRNWIPMETNATNRLLYVDKETGDLVVKTPSDVLRWPDSFRLRVIKESRIEAVIDLHTAQKYKDYMCDPLYKISGNFVQFVVLLKKNQKNQLVVNTYVYRYGAPAMLQIAYPQNIPMRVLMTHCYITGTDIAGMPQFPFESVPQDLLSTPRPTSSKLKKLDLNVQKIRMPAK